MLKRIKILGVIIFILILTLTMTACNTINSIIHEAASEEMILVEAGSVGELTIYNDFYIGRYHITQEKFEHVMGFNPSYFNDNDHPNIIRNSDNRPVERVTWYDAVKYANKLSEIEGLDKYYNISEIEYKGDDAESWEHPQNIDSATVTKNALASGYRLPTKNEHMFSSFGGIDGDANRFAGSSDLDEVGWYLDNSDVANSEYDYRTADGNGTMPVGEKEANELGLYDMSGNVWDWTNTVEGPGLIIRGGSWRDGAHKSVVYDHEAAYPHSNSGDIGFRLARRP